MANFKNRMLNVLKRGQGDENLIDDISQYQQNLLANHSNPVFDANTKNKILKHYTELDKLKQLFGRYSRLRENNYIKDSQEERKEIERILSDDLVGDSRYVWRSENSANTCEVCKALNGREFDFYDKVPQRPHPNCKCKVKIVQGQDVKNDKKSEFIKSFYQPVSEMSNTLTSSRQLDVSLIQQSSEFMSVDEVYNYLQLNNGHVPNAKITKNIFWKEMIGNSNTNEERKKDCTREILANVYKTALQLQQIHDLYWQGRPLIISSGWRSFRNNKSCGGNIRSRHLFGKAVDFHLGLPTIKSDFNTMSKYWKGFVLFEGTWIHAQMD